MNHRKITPGKKDQLIEEYPYVSNADLSGKYGLKQSYIETIACKLGLKKINGNNPHPPKYDGTMIDIEFPDKKKKKVDWRQIINQLQDIQGIYRGADAGQNSATVNIKTDKPVIIAFSACWHLASQFTNYEEWQNSLDFVLNTPNLYLGICGDMIDNFMFNFRSSRAVSAMMINAELQQVMLGALLQELDSKNKIIFKTMGNHEHMFEKLSGSRLGQFLFGGENDKSPYLPNGGVVTVKVGNQVYEILAKHNYRFSSYMNPLHKPAQMHRNHYPAEICVTAHEHNPAMSMQYIGTQKVYLFRTGSFKVDDDFSVAYFKEGVMGTPCVKLYPDRHLIVPYETPELAVGDN